MSSTVTSRRDRIVEVFESLPEPESLQEITAACMNAAVFSKDELDKMVFAGCQKVVRDALNDLDISGCPIALLRTVKIERDGELVKVELRVQRDFQREGDAIEWIKRRSRQMRDDYDKFTKSINALGEKFPNIDLWSFVDPMFHPRD